jgi:hypothetical protein
MSSILKTVSDKIIHGWVVEYPGRNADGPADFFAQADPAPGHPVTTQLNKSHEMDATRDEQKSVSESDHEEKL